MRYGESCAYKAGLDRADRRCSGLPRAFFLLGWADCAWWSCCVASQRALRANEVSI